MTLFTSWENNGLIISLMTSSCYNLICFVRGGLVVLSADVDPKFRFHEDNSSVLLVEFLIVTLVGKFYGRS